MSVNLGTIENRTVFQHAKNRIEDALRLSGIENSDDGVERAFSVFRHMDRSWFNAANAYDRAHRASVDHVTSVIARRDLDAAILQDTKDVAMAIDQLASAIEDMVSMLEETDTYTHVEDGESSGEEREMTVYMSSITALRWVLNDRDFDDIHAMFNCISFVDALTSSTTSGEEWTPRAMSFVAEVNRHFEAAIRLSINTSESGPTFFAWQVNCLANRQADPSTFETAMEWLDQQAMDEADLEILENGATWLDADRNNNSNS